MRKTWVASLVMSSKSIGWTKLSKAWTKDFLDAASSKAENANVVGEALVRTIPLLEDPTAVPFVCRYRSDLIAPLSAKMVHQLSGYLQIHKSLESLRERILEKLPETEEEMRLRVETSISKSELEDIYAPYKPPAKGSLEDRIRKEHPGLIEAVDAFWSDPLNTNISRLKPFDAAVTVLANRIASYPATMDACQEYTNQWCRVKVRKASTKKDDDSKVDHEAHKYTTYYEFDSSLNRLRDHQVLAIRRGVDKKALKLTFEIDNELSQARIRHSLGNRTTKHYALLWKDAIHDAWSRLLRKRCTSRAWKKCCGIADERAIEVFCENLRKALLAPPAMPASAVLGLDPGFRAGIKTAIIDSNGQVVDLNTVHFTESREKGKSQLGEILKIVQEHQQVGGKLVVALGNGHGTQEARQLLLEASESCELPVDIHLVNEAGASVWSVTEAAGREFPHQKPASIAAVSIARRYQDPLPELVKVPPRSLGLGMYQHDFAEKVLEPKLHITSVDAVAEVGVDANACSLEILEKVPGVTTKLAERIMKARPLKSRSDLLKISGLGPKTFENCAAFIRVNGENYLDRTLCHPESYELADYLLRELKWNVTDPSSVGELPTESERRVKWKNLVEKAAKHHAVAEDRVLLVLDHLIHSITNPDPRLGADDRKTSAIGDSNGCSSLPSHLAQLEELKKACPVRDVVGHVRNIVDFGAFIDYGGENDGLIHRSKLGHVPLDSLLVGQEVSVDILGVSNCSRVTLSLSGLGCPAESLDSQRVNGASAPKTSTSRESRSNGTKKRHRADSSKSTLPVIQKPRVNMRKRQRTGTK